MSFEIIYMCSLVSGLIILMGALATLLTDKCNFWPPPEKNSWQGILFWMLFRFFVIPFFIILIDQYSMNNSSQLLFLFGSFTFIVSFILATMVTFKLGIGNTYGGKEGLVTGGFYSISRNPVYLFTMFGLVGISIAIPTFKVISISLIWFILYIIAPIIEEPWLKKAYGSEYIEYCKKVPRYIWLF